MNGLTAAHIIPRGLPSAVVYITTSLPRTFDRAAVRDMGVRNILDKYQPLKEIADVVKRS